MTRWRCAFQDVVVFLAAVYDFKIWIFWAVWKLQTKIIEPNRENLGIGNSVFFQFKPNRPVGLGVHTYLKCIAWKHKTVQIHFTRITNTFKLLSVNTYNFYRIRRKQAFALLTYSLLWERNWQSDSSGIWGLDIFE